MAEKKFIVKKRFVIVSASGSMSFTEGQGVSEDIAKRFPQYIVGRKTDKPKKHDPSLPQKLKKSVANKMPEETLLAWIEQYYPASVPKELMEKADLITLVMDLQEK